ncbi:MAG TPA: xanthine dehydrogenase family protein subunit M [Gemmatimonadales bacterium]|jgi:CO/xanthine dehydrogenase FAD-binding subunit|nr:xanthine dehydrogenase family protein subunit M [Gemmatimonadales bacterium]
MRTAISSLDLRRPASLEEALGILRDEPRTPLAGATDLYVALNFGTLEPKRFLDLWPLDELREISARGDTLVLGALVTFTALIRSPLVAARLPMLVEAAALVGGRQIQNRGTLGGNIANASPAGDSLPVLAAADAVLVLRSADAERRVPITGFYTGYRKTVLRPDELIVAVEVPRIAGRQYFRKVGTRAAQAISKVVFAGVGGAAPRLAFGSIAPVVIRARATERALAAGAGIEEAVRILEGEIAPIDDLRSSAAYRRRVAGNLLRRFSRA